MKIEIEEELFVALLQSARTLREHEWKTPIADRQPNLENVIIYAEQLAVLCL